MEKYDTIIINVWTYFNRLYVNLLNVSLDAFLVNLDTHICSLNSLM